VGESLCVRACVCLYSWLSYPAANRTFSESYYTVISDPSGSTKFFYIISQRHDFRGEKQY
jgi:hypothetical protein